MKLEQLLEGVPYTLVQGSLELDIEDIIYDSRKAAPGRLFVCIVGTQRDSHDYAAQCAAEGVTALVIQHDIDLSAVPGVTVLKVESSRYALALMSGNLFGNPSRRMTMIGVTGTKGKTTTAYYIKSIVDAWLAGQGHRESALLSTIVTDDGVERRPAKLTTPEPLDLQRHLWNAVSAGADYLTMEVSSQALKYGRVIGVELACAVFLNIGEDHISPVEHPDLEDYLNSKLLIFQQARSACVCLDLSLIHI